MARATLSEQVFTELKGRILGYRWPAGERLHVDQIAKELDVSVSPVKEALKQLEATGLVEIHARRGTRVRSFTEQDVVDIFAAREILEPNVAIQAIRNGGVDGAMMAELDETISRLEALRDGAGFTSVVGAMEADGDFHRAIARGTGNRVLESMQSALADQAHLIRYFSTTAPRALDTLAEHRAIRDALVAGDESGVEQFARDHIHAVRTRILVDMRKGDGKSL